MLPHEQQLLEQFLQRVNAASGVPQDPQAQALIQQRLATQPDAAYLLVQRTMLLEQAWEAAQQKIAELEQKLQQPAPSAQATTSFLGGGLDTRFGRNPESAPTSYASAPAAGPAHQGGNWRQRWFGAPPVPAAPATTSTAPYATPSAGASASWLGSAASAAAGVAGGMFLFNGLERMMGNHPGSDGQANHLNQTPPGTSPSSDSSHSALAHDAGADAVDDASWSQDDGGFSDSGGDGDA